MHLLISTLEPDYDPVVTLAPFQPLLCKVLHIPLDPRLNAQEAQLLVNELHPQHLIVPKSHDGTRFYTYSKFKFTLLQYWPVQLHKGVLFRF